MSREETREETRLGKWAVRYRVIRRLAGGEHEDLLHGASKDLPTTPGEANQLLKVLDNSYKMLNPGRTPNLDIVAFLVHDNVDDGGDLEFEFPLGEEGDGDDDE